MASSLPVELYDEIISYLWDDKTALAACSITSRALTFPSQRLLFYQIILVSPKFSTRDPSCGTASSFWNNVLKKSPHIAEYVQCLQVINDIDRQCWVFHEAFLSKILPLHTRLSALVVFQVEWEFLSEDVQRVFQDVVRLPSLVHLDISCRLVVHFWQQLSDNLKHLVLHYNYHAYRPQLEPVDARASPIYLEPLYLPEAVPLLRPINMMNLESRFKLNHLRKLGVNMNAYSYYDSVDYRRLSLVLLLCRETLEELQLTLHPNFSPETLPQFTLFDLSLMASLKTFTLSFNASDRRISWGPTSCLNFLLCSVSSPYQRLEEIVIVVRLHDPGDNNRTDHDSDIHWEKVSGFFRDENQCPRLRKLSIYCVNDFKYRSRFIKSIDDSESTRKLRARTGMEFIAMDGKSVDYWKFPMDERWDNVAAKG